MPIPSHHRIASPAIPRPLQVPLNAPLSCLNALFKKDAFCLVIATQRSCAEITPRLRRDYAEIVVYFNLVDLIRHPPHTAGPDRGPSGAGNGLS